MLIRTETANTCTDLYAKVISDESIVVRSLKIEDNRKERALTKVVLSKIQMRSGNIFFPPNSMDTFVQMVGYIMIHNMQNYYICTFTKVKLSI